MEKWFIPTCHEIKVIQMCLVDTLSSNLSTLSRLMREYIIVNFFFNVQLDAAVSTLLCPLL